MRPPLLEAGDHERLKAAIHGTLGGLALMCFVYNVAVARMPRCETRHIINVGLYGALVAWECATVLHHVRNAHAR